MIPVSGFFSGSSCDSSLRLASGFSGGCGLSIFSCSGFSSFFAGLTSAAWGIGICAGACAGWVIVVFGCVSSGMPLNVSNEPIHPIIPRYMMCMTVTMSGARAWLKAATRSCEASMLMSSERSQ